MTKNNYAKFDSYPARTDITHRQQANDSRTARTEKDRNDIEKETGARYSELYRLPYYDCIRMVAIDIMHALLLGTSKHVMKIWTSKGIIDQKKIKTIQETVDNMTVPNNIGRIPGKISSGFSGFTADQWRSWTCCYSLIALKNVIPDRDYKCWQRFVLACDILCSRAISTHDILKADGLLKAFCKQFASLYGEDQCTPNMHLHTHLKQCMQDFGPAYCFWLYSYERYNGSIAAVPTNNKLVSVQFMRKFLHKCHMDNCEWPGNFPVLQNILNSDMKCALSGTLKTVDIDGDKMMNELSNAYVDINKLSFTCSVYQTPIGKEILITLDTTEKEAIQDMLCNLYPDCDLITVSYLADSYQRIVQGTATYYAGEQYNSKVMIRWAEDDGNGMLSVNPEALPRLAELINIYKVNVVITRMGKKKQVQHYIARVNWFKVHPQQSHFGSPVTVWCKTIEGETVASYIPLQRLHIKCVTTILTVEFGRSKESVLVAVPVKYGY